MSLKINSNITFECLNEDILAQIIKDNTFENPIYNSNEQAGRSNWDTEETIQVFRYENGELILPRGYMNDLLQICKSHGVTPEIVDERTTKSCTYPDSLIGIVKRSYQIKAIEKALGFSQGLLVSPTGSGKSLMALEIIRTRGQKALILVHRQELGLQWKSVIEKHLGLEVGFIGDGEWAIGNEITVALIQTLSSREEDCKRISNEFGLICVDECAHVPAKTFYNVIGLFPAKYRYGLSAILDRRDGLMDIIFRAIGPVMDTITKIEVEAVRSIVPAEVMAIETGFEPTDLKSWNDYLTALSADSSRNELIIDIAKSQTTPTLILCDRIVHCEQLSGMMTRRGIDHILAHGKVKKRSEAMENMRQAQITLGTTSLLGEGIDVSVWGVLILASPISSEIKLMQAVGRCVRPAVGKEKAIVYDLKDSCGFSGSSFKKRFEIYKKHKIWVEFHRKKNAA
jgi:superfamily II DNA or RNA helicase